MGNGGDVDCPPSAVPLTDADACEVAAKALSKAGSFPEKKQEEILVDLFVDEWKNFHPIWGRVATPK